MNSRAVTCGSPIDHVLDVGDVPPPSPGRPNAARIEGGRESAQIGHAAGLQRLDDRQDVGRERVRVLRQRPPAKRRRLADLRGLPSLAP
jgi:hypothetical protein